MPRVALLGILVALLGAAAWFVFFSEGQQPPTAEIDAAKQRASEAIERSEANVYAPAAAQAVRDSLAMLDGLVEEQLGRLPFRRKYDHVLERLTNVDAAVREMEDLARQAKAQMAIEVGGVLAQAVAVADSADAELRSFPASKDRPSALRAFRDHISAARQAISAAQSTLASGRPAAALPEANAARDRARALLQEIRETKQRVKALRGRDDF